MKGYIKALGEAKLPFHPEFVFSYDTESKPDLYTNLKDFLAKNRDILTSIACYNDEVGLVVANICRQLGISIPEELSISCQYNVIIAKNTHIEPTTITQPQEQIARDAAEWIIKKLQGNQNMTNE